MSEVATIPAALGGGAVASQATAVEQARAVAEVQAAVTVAQQVPRNRGRAEADMRDSCGRMALARQAFYSMPRAGGKVEGSTVHLARELARIWGNIDYGVRELRRDDEAGESEIQAYAWDQEANVRSTRSFIVPHARMAKKQRSKLTDLGDIYLNNQNVGARAVRECIFTVLPAWFVADAEDSARRTLQEGEGKSLGERVSDMLAAFQQYGVTEQMIADRIGRPRSSWTAGDLAELLTTYGTLSRGEASPADLFEPAQSDAEKALTNKEN